MSKKTRCDGELYKAWGTVFLWDLVAKDLLLTHVELEGVYIKQNAVRCATALRSDTCYCVVW